MAMNWQDWTPRETAVLVLLLDGDRGLLIHKKRGLGQGKINLPGGRVEAGETWEQAARRETREETGVTVETLESVASLRFQFTNGYGLSVRAFLATGWSGVLTPCDEAVPFWHPLVELPWNRFWADDALWLPEVLRGGTVEARFLFDEDKMVEAEIAVRPRPGVPSNG